MIYETALTYYFAHGYITGIEIQNGEIVLVK
jgi:hypothetical protein